MVYSSISRSRWLSTLLYLGGVLVLMGCGKPGPGKFYPVSGKVTLDGKPLTSGVVGFALQDAPEKSAQFTPIGMIGSDGTYEIKTNGKAGAPLGKYKVTVNPGMPMDPAQMDPAKMAKMDPEKMMRPAYHPRYTDPIQTPLTVEVVESPKPGAYDLKLTK